MTGGGADVLGAGHAELAGAASRLGSNESIAVRDIKVRKVSEGLWFGARVCTSEAVGGQSGARFCLRNDWRVFRSHGLCFRSRWRCLGKGWRDFGRAEITLEAATDAAHRSLQMKLLYKVSENTSTLLSCLLFILQSNGGLHRKTQCDQATLPV